MKYSRSIYNPQEYALSPVQVFTAIICQVVSAKRYKPSIFRQILNPAPSEPFSIQGHRILKRHACQREAVFAEIVQEFVKPIAFSRFSHLPFAEDIVPVFADDFDVGRAALNFRAAA